MANAALRPGLSTIVNQTLLGISPRMFVSPAAAGRKITAGFSFIHRISKTSSIDVWFPEAIQRQLDAVVASGQTLGPEHFPAQWAAVRQFELLQESGNYKVYDMDVTNLRRTLQELTRNMRAGGYRVTVATLGSYTETGAHDELEILDKRLQDRISKLIHMLYLDEQSENMNEISDRALAAGTWDYRTALPHIGATLGARDLFKPLHAHTLRRKHTFTIPQDGKPLMIPNFIKDHGVTDILTGIGFARTEQALQRHHYRITGQGAYNFAPEDAGREIIIDCTIANPHDGADRKLSSGERKHVMARHFFDVLNLLPNKHIVHDTAVGLQLPESINEHEWIYLAESDQTLGAFNSFLRDIFTPFDKFSMSGIDGRDGAKPEPKASVQHMQSYGDRMNAGADAFYRSLAAYTHN